MRREGRKRRMGAFVEGTVAVVRWAEGERAAKVPAKRLFVLRRKVPDRSSWGLHSYGFMVSIKILIAEHETSPFSALVCAQRMTTAEQEAPGTASDGFTFEPVDEAFLSSMANPEAKDRFLRWYAITRAHKHTHTRT